MQYFHRAGYLNVTTPHLNSEGTQLDFGHQLFLSFYSVTPSFPFYWCMPLFKK